MFYSISLPLVVIGDSTMKLLAKAGESISNITDKVILAILIDIGPSAIVLGFLETSKHPEAFS